MCIVSREMLNGAFCWAGGACARRGVRAATDDDRPCRCRCRLPRGLSVAASYSRTAFSLRPSGRCHVSVIVRSSPLSPFEPRSIVIFILWLICIQLPEQTLLYGLQCSMDCSDLRLDFNKFVNSAISVFVTPAWIKPINEKLLVFHITFNEFTSGTVC